MRVGRRFALFVLAAGAAGLCFALVTRYSKYSGPDLLTEATPVLLLRSPSNPFFIAWLDNHTLLLSRLDEHLPGFFAHDIHTSREVQMGGLEELNSPGVVGLGGLSSPVKISPDSTRLLWQDGGAPGVPMGYQQETNGNFATNIGPDGQRYGSFDIRTTLHVAPLQNSPGEICTWKQREYASALLWLNDSRHFIDLNTDSSAILVHDYLHPASIQTLKPRQAADLDAIRSVKQMTQGNCLICASAFYGTYPVATQTDVSLLPIMQDTEHGMALGNLQHYTVKFPPHAHIWATSGDEGYAFSPRGDKIAWWLKFDDDVPLSVTVLTAPFHNSTEPNDQMQREKNIMQRVENVDRAPLWLWICNIDGTNMHSVGKIAFDPKADIYANTANSLQWLPDSSHLSFQYRNSLRVVPAD